MILKLYHYALKRPFFQLSESFLRSLSQLNNNEASVISKNIDRIGFALFQRICIVSEAIQFKVLSLNLHPYIKLT